MNDDQNIVELSDLELRVQRLEKIHVWAITIITFGLVGYYFGAKLFKK
jgi:hypothetical protein